MDDTPINLENILEQAPKWTFAGDFTLLQWMNQISQDLETRATKTTENLSKLNNNIRSTNVALDNVANSLTALQFGNQFVECRVQDDDETIMNTSEATTSSENQNQTERTLSSKEMLDTFLENNLKVLRNCHEKYSIDLDDSDEEDEGKSKENTCIYQPINPYNEKPLPYIFGSKDWHAKWHVGLYENQEENSYSGDEISEAFSESSTSHVDDNESFESNTEWSSSYSIDNDNINTNIEVKNASSLRGSQSIYPGTKSIPINVNKNKVAISESSSLSTQSSSSVAKKSIHSTKPNEILTNRTESINSLSSKNSVKPNAKENKENILKTKIPTPKYVDLFAEPPEDVQSTTSSTGSSSTHNRMPAQYTKQTLTTERPSTFRSQPPPQFVDLFAEPPEDIPSSTTSSVSSAGQQHIKRKTVNLFDDDEEDDLAKDDLLSSITKKENLEQTKKVEKTMLSKTKPVMDKPLTVTKTSKSLFEDSEEDDDDFLKAFVKKSSVKDTPKTSLTKSLFDNEIPQNNANKIVNETKEKATANDLPNKKQNLFNEIEDNENDFLFTKVQKDNSKFENVTAVNKNISAKEPKENIKKTVNIFDDLEDDFKPQSLQPKDKPKKINLFDDLDDDEGDDIFAIKPKPIIKEKIEVKNTIARTISKENVSEEIKYITKNDHKNIVYKEILSEETVEKSLANIDEKNDQVNIKSKKLEEPFVESLLGAIKKDINFEEPYIEHKIEHKHDADNDINVQDPPKIIEEKPEKLSKTFEKVNESKQSVKQAEFSVQKSRELMPELENKEILKEQNPPRNEEKVEATVESQLEITSEIPASIENAKKELNNNDTLSLPREQIIPISTNEHEKPSTSKYDFNSILFLDEPPDDDNEFFETLTKTPQTLNTNYNSIDLEHDLYEPELPKVPGTNGNNKPTDIVENKPTNVYTGLQLFSDIPPEDDGEADDIEKDNNAVNISNDNNQTKRLHSVFYDDFNETLMALNKNQIEKEIPKHSIFNEEPPPINEEFSSMSKDLIDHKVPAPKVEDIAKEDFKNKTSEIVSKLEETQNKLDNKTDSLTTSKRSVSKLQMPHININVQALLPGANNTLRKVKEDVSTPTVMKEAKTNTNISALPVNKEKQASVLEKPTVEVKRTAETEHILPSVTKNRIKGPARRPSTRRARQENYRKSMIEEDKQHMESDDDIKPKQKENTDVIKAITNIPKNVLIPAEEKTKTEIAKEQNKDKPKEDKVINPLSSILFEDNSIDDLDIFSVTKKPIKADDSNTNKLTEELTDKLKQVKKVDNETPKEQGIKTKTVTNKSSLLFEDDDEGDDDLFKHIKPTKINENKPVKDLVKAKEIINTTVNKPVINTSLNNTKHEVTKEIPVVDSTTVISKLDTKPQQTLKTDDDLFNKSHDIETTKPPINEINKKTKNPSSTIKVKPSFLEEDDNEDGNDLFKTTLPKPNISKSSFNSTNKTKPQFKSFLDSESDDDDTKVAGLPTTSSVKSQTVTNTTTTTSNTKELVQKNTNTKLFNDSDTDSDDLFGKLSTTKTSNQKITTQVSSVSSIITKKQTKTQPPQSSLFSDESDDDEDFLKPASKVIKTPATKSTLQENKTKIANQTNSSLFSDIDSDEDDLFGGGGASGTTKGTTPKATPIPTVKIPTTTKPSVAPPTAEVAKPKTVTSDNPLADLL